MNKPLDTEINTVQDTQPAGPVNPPDPLADLKAKATYDTAMGVSPSFESDDMEVPTTDAAAEEAAGQPTNPETGEIVEEQQIDQVETVQDETQQEIQEEPATQQYLTTEEFNAVYSRDMKSLQEQMSGLAQAIQAMQSQQIDNSTVSIDQQITDLQNEREEAIEEGGRYEDVIELDKRIDGLTKQKDNAQANKPAPPPDFQPEFKAWMDRNPWFNGSGPDDLIMTGAANAIAGPMIEQGYELKEVLAAVDKEMARKFPPEQAPQTTPQTTTQKTTVKKASPVVASGSVQGVPPVRESESDVAVDDLTDEDRAHARNFMALFPEKYKTLDDFVKSVNETESQRIRRRSVI